MPLVLATTTPGEPELFASFQGEGPSAGRPCAFVRLSRCNLACQWCDTAYTWRFTGDNRPHRDDAAYERTVNQITLSEGETAQRIAALGQDRLVITGGEPLLQATALGRMVIELKALRPMRIEVETNGTVTPPDALLGLIDQWNVSPKLAHSGNARDLALRPEALERFAAEPRAYFKFVVADPGDVDEALALQREFAIPAERTFLMPEGRDSEALRSRARWLAPLAAAHGFAFSDRLHIHVFGDTRGT